MKNPDGSDLRAAFRVQLKKVLEEDTAFADDLKQRVDSARTLITYSSTQVGSGYILPAGECLRSTSAGTRTNESPSHNHPELPSVLARLGSVVIVGVGIAFTGLVGYLALTYQGDIVSLIKLVVMVVPAASIYVSNGSRGALLLHIILFTLIALLSGLGGNPGLAFAAVGIMAYAVLSKLHQVA